MTSFGNRVSADIIKLKIKVIRADYNLVDWCPYKEKNSDAHMQMRTCQDRHMRKDGCVKKAEAETVEMHLQAK